MGNGQRVCASRELTHTLQQETRLLWAVALLTRRHHIQLSVAHFGEEAGAPTASLRIALQRQFFEIDPTHELAPHSATLLHHLLSAEGDEGEAEGGRVQQRDPGDPMGAAPVGEGQDLRDRIYRLALPNDWQLEQSDPPGLLCRLFRYQRRELAWAFWRERLGSSCSGTGPVPCDRESLKSQLAASNLLWQPVRLPAGPTMYVAMNDGVARLKPVQPPLPEVVGGLLTDEMGLGKTVQAIALCLANRPPPSWAGGMARAAPAAARLAAPPPADPAACADGDAAAAAWPSGAPCADAAEPTHAAGPAAAGKLPGGTLVVCPPTLLQQWKAEILNHAGGSLSVYCYEGLATLASEADQEKRGRQKKKPGQREMELYDRLLAGGTLEATYDAVAQADGAVQELLAADVVLTTFDVLRAEVGGEPKEGRSGWGLPAILCVLALCSWVRACKSGAAYFALLWMHAGILRPACLPTATSREALCRPHLPAASSQLVEAAGGRGPAGRVLQCRRWVDQWLTWLAGPLPRVWPSAAKAGILPKVQVCWPWPAGVMVQRLETRSIWCLTGTPLRGSTLRQELDSLAGLLQLVRHPLGEPAAWKRLVAQPLERGTARQQQGAWQLLEAVLRPLMWRNNKVVAGEALTTGAAFLSPFSWP